MAERQPHGRDERPSDVPSPGKSKPPRGRRLPSKGADIVALDARARAFGLEPSAEARAIASAPYMGSPLGLVVARHHPHETASRLWTVWQAFCAAARTYRHRILGVSVDPKTTAGGMVASGFTTDVASIEDLREDTRTAAERDEDARTIWAHWQGLLVLMGPGMATPLQMAERGEGPVLWIAGAPSPEGNKALRDLTRRPLPPLPSKGSISARKDAPPVAPPPSWTPPSATEAMSSLKDEEVRRLEADRKARAADRSLPPRRLPPLWVDAHPTEWGTATLRALERLADLAEA